MGDYSGVSVDDFYANFSAHIEEVYSPPLNPLDRATMKHDIAYGIARDSKRNVVRIDIEEIPHGENPWMTPVTRGIINIKQ